MRAEQSEHQHHRGDEMQIKPRAGAKAVIGLDLGGTNARAAVVYADGTKGRECSLPSCAKEGGERVRQQVVKVIREAMQAEGLSNEDIGAVGAAVPGHIDPVTGVIIWSPNFGSMVDDRFQIFLDVPFAGPVAEDLGIAVYAGNDANVAAMGAYRDLKAGGWVEGDLTDIVLFTLGTGIGTGVISGGRLVTGSTGGAVELGHQVIVAGGRQCSCGTLGCLEAYCGTAAIVDRALRMLELNRESVLWDMIQRDKKELTPKTISVAAEQGDRTARDVWEETGYYLGIGMANAVNIFNPQLIVLAGQTRKGPGLIAAAERSMRRHAVYSIAKTCKVVEMELADAPGIPGGAELAWEKVRAAAS